MKYMYKRIKLVVLISALFAVGFGTTAIAQTATVYVLRKSVTGALFKFPVTVNDILCGEIGSKKYIECTVSVGRVSVSCCVLDKVYNLDLDAEPGRKYYVLINPVVTSTMNGFLSRLAGDTSDVKLSAHLYRLDDAEGAALVNKFKMQTVADLTNGSVTPTADSPAAPQGTFSEQLACSQQRYASTKHLMMDVVAKKDEIFLSDKDKQELSAINETLSDVNNSLYAVSNDRGSDVQKMQQLAKINEALSILDNRIRTKYGSFIADAGNAPVPVAASSDNGAVVQHTATAAAVQSVVKSDVDVNIPETGIKSENTFALIIANENYEFVDDVQFAINDGEIFREYCIKTLGIPERQVWLYKNASGGIIAGGVDKMLQAMNIFDNSKVIVYYCGHGIPDEKTGDAYIIPTDGKGTNVATCYSLNRLYKTLSSAKASSVTYFMDACFTGANRDGSMLVAARGVAREAKKEVVTGNTVVFSAASGDETAMPYKEKCHGLFTYFLLKKLQETQGNVSYGELAEYINSNVKKEAFLTNEKPQNPVVATSESVSSEWKKLRIK